ncbi:MAG TPA: type VI secretion system tip protein TssI/VgrG [Roseiarcus sp.]|jgi:type VI secretion system secreted protein VgrG
MPDSLSQDGRVAKLTTALGADVLVLSRFDGSEGLSDPFEFRVEALSTQANIDFNAALGRNISVEVKAADGGLRHFSGILTEARWAGKRQDLFAYQLVMRPWLWLLTLTSDCRIFSQKSAPDIIKQVFGDRGFTDFRVDLQASYPKLEYCVQYRETDFDFVSRLMEKFGIYYYFEHADETHTLVLADKKSCHKPCSGLAEVEYVPGAEAGRREQQHLEEWTVGRQVESGAFKLNEYDYRHPSTSMLTKDDMPGGYSHDRMEMYDYPGGYQTPSEGDPLVKVRTEAAQSLDDRRTATGSAVSLYPGGLVNVKKVKGEDAPEEHLVVACSHFFSEQGYRSGEGGANGSSYVGNFEFTPSERPFRAELDTPLPRIPGVQSALVVGEKGQEIDVDEMGRICVQFYWDRKQTPSRRVRVAQFWAGKTRGAWFVPRIGDEVLVQYEDGDPDRPIVVGSVYNGTNTVPTKLPSNQTHSGILTKSSKNSSGYNMLLFDDTEGKERIKLRAEKDLMFKALNNEQRTILANQTEQVGGDETITVGDTTIGAKSVGGNFTLNALETATINVGPQGAPLTQIVMDTTSITLNVGPDGACSQIMMTETGILLSVMGVSTVEITPAGVSIIAPTVEVEAEATVDIVAPAVAIIGNVAIEGALEVDGMAPMLLPA